MTAAVADDDAVVDEDEDEEGDADAAIWCDQNGHFEDVLEYEEVADQRGYEAGEESEDDSWCCLLLPLVVVVCLRSITMF